MANTANSALTTNFNVTPYYDDYDELKNYYRILYKPGFAVQARELTQMQTMLQKQVDRFGKHVFKEGSIVLPGEFSIETDLDYVKIKDVDTTGNAVNMNDYINTTLTGQTSNIQAYVVNVLEGVETETNTKTLYVKYQTGSDTNTAVKTFLPGEVLISSTKPNLTTLSTDPVGKASRFIIREGVFFAKEHFIRFDTQSTIIGRYTNNPTCRVGFKVIEKIVNSDEDASLLDPALEASNYFAPGADRLHLTPELQVKDITDDTGAPEFVELFTIKDGVLTERYDRSQYNILLDEMAKRTSDESGDYYVRGLSIRLRENLDTGNNAGLSTTGNSQLLSVGVEPGLAYVKGYEINKLVTDYVEIPKALDYSNVSSQITTSVIGSYVTLTEVSGAVVADRGQAVSLYSTAVKSITNKSWSAIPAGNPIGSARVMSIGYNDDTLGKANASVLLYLTDIKMTGSNNFSQVKSVSVNNSGARSNFVGDVLLDTANNAILNDVRSGALLYPVGSSAVKTVRDENGDPSLQFNFLRTSDVTVQGSTGSFTVSLASSAENETFPYGTQSALSSADKREIILTINQSINVAIPGATVTAVAGSNTLTGLNSTFTNLNVGDKIQFAGRVNNAANTFTIAAIANNNSLTTVETLPAVTNAAFFKAYRAGDVIDLTTKGVTNGLVRTVSTTPSLLSFALNEAFPTDFSATVTYQAVRTDAREIQKLLRPSRLVQINVSNHPNGLKGPFSLGFSDVYRIKKIVKKTDSFPESLTDGSDVTSQFTFDNGQRDMFYDHATITPNSSLQSTDRLLVEFDYFEPSFAQGKGYFSIDSYPVDDDIVSSTTIRTEEIPFFVSPRDKSIYNLRNFIDVRPLKAATATDTTTLDTVSTNPDVSTNFNFETNGMRLPVPSTQLSYDYSYYYARRDLVTIDKSGFISVVQGTPSSYPITPSTPANVMALGSIFVTPYPSLAPNYAQMIGRLDLACVVKKLSNIRFTMRDIGLLKQRIENLEYYASLSLLEKSAVDMKVLDENGLERFKNGIFVDTFANHELGDQLNPNYRIVVDPEEKTIRPKYTMNSIEYDYKGGNQYVKKTGDLITLDYDEVLAIDQNAATSFRNVELTSYRFLGELFMNPETDVWVDTDQAPDEHIIQGAEVANSSTTTSLGTTWGNWQTTWNSWQTTVTGYEAYNSRGQLVGTYKTQAQAQAQFDSDRTVKMTSTTKFIAPTAGQTYGTVTNVYINGKFYSNYALSPGDGLIYEITAGSQTGASTRTGTEMFQTTTVTATSTTENIGSKIIDVNLIPYIRPQVIKIYARGLKPKTRVFPFFDNEPMYMYTRPITEAMYNEVPNASTTSMEGDTLITNEFGEIFLHLRLPAEKPFRFGTKEVVITDSLTNNVDASTKAVGYFVAQGLVQQKQNTILTTRGSTTTTSTSTVSLSQTKNVSNTRTSSNLVAFVDDISCSAYSFVPKAPEGEEGIFLTSVEIFFAAKHPTLGVWVEIREMDNASGITRNQVPFSEVWLSASEIVTSTDASVPQKITFPSPVFLYNDVQYAFVIHTVGINPDTYLWVARLGENNVTTGTQYSSRPLTGTFYTTNNNRNWDIVPDIDMKIRFYRADFVKNVIGEAILGNKTTEEVTLTTNTTEVYNYGEPFLGRYRLTLSGNTNSILPNDIIVGQTSGVNTKVLSVSSNLVKADHSWNTSSGTPRLNANNFIQNEIIRIHHANGVFKGLTTAVSAIERAVAKLKRYKKSKTEANKAIAEFKCDSSTSAKFEVNDVLAPVLPQTKVNLVSGNITVTTTNTQTMTVTVGSIKDMRYSVVDFEPSFLTFNKTAITYEMQTTANASYIKDSYFKINPNENYYFAEEKAILSRSNELQYLAGAPSNNVKVNMISTTGYLSPVIDLGRTQTVIVDNIVNSDTYAEDATGYTLKLANATGISTTDVIVGSTSSASAQVISISGTDITVVVPVKQFVAGETVVVYNAAMTPKGITTTISSIVKDNKQAGGNLINKYISKPITLAEGQDAEDLLVLLTAYKPPGTNVKVWVKILNNEDSDSFTQLPWIELTSGDTESFSSLSSRNDFIELKYTFPDSQKTGENKEVQYKNSAGITFTGFKYYAIKIGLLGDNSAVVPRVGDLRAIALQI